MTRNPVKTVVAVAAAAAASYVALCAALYVVMLQPPPVIGSVFNRVPWPFWAAVPMKAMWLDARDGRLRVGDQAPAFDLPTFDRKSRVSLASLRGKPAVLVFGSYT